MNKIYTSIALWCLRKTKYNKIWYNSLRHDVIEATTRLNKYST